MWRLVLLIFLFCGATPGCAPATETWEQVNHPPEALGVMREHRIIVPLPPFDQVEKEVPGLRT